MKYCSIGGQAVIEGVMMRSPEKTAIAVRKPDSDILVKEEPTRSLARRYRFFKLPVLRGILAFVESLVVGIEALSFSASVAGADEDEKLTGRDIAVAVISAVAFAVLLFIIIPTFLVRFMRESVSSPYLLNLVEGIIRILIFLIYVVIITRMKDIRRVFEYHGAEHKTIHCYEAGRELTVENIKPYSTLHPRCGTSFLMVVMVISILLFSLLGWPGVLVRIMSRLLLLPLVAGLSYEVIRYAGRSSGPIIRAVNAPGMMLQRLTTREPDEAQIEVAIKALKAVIPEANREGSRCLKNLTVLNSDMTSLRD